MRRLRERTQFRIGIRKQCIRDEADKFSGVAARALDVTTAPAQVNLQVTGFDPAMLLQLLPERGNPRLSLGIIFHGIHQHSNASHTCHLLRVLREWPCDG